MVPWFQDARRNPDSKYRDWYIWSDKKPGNADKGMVFPGVQKSTWTHDTVAKRWYFHRFYDFQPDLNTSHAAVEAEILNRSWVFGYSSASPAACPYAGPPGTASQTLC